MKPVLICGGVGKKLWPLSRFRLPKHFLPLFGGKSLFEMSYQALRRGFKPEEIFIQTVPNQAKIAQKIAPEIPLKNYFIEPETRDQGPATAFLAAKLFTLDPDEPFMVIQADVIREPGEKLLEMIKKVGLLIEKEKRLVTGGSRPEYPVMGIDYLKVKKEATMLGEMKFYEMDEWLGRDTRRETVEAYLSKKLVLMHTNHYAWTPRLMLEAIKRKAPDWYKSLEKMMKIFGTKNEEKIVGEEYRKMEKGPIERVTQSELENGYIVELPFKWVDFGTWESVARYKIARGEYQPGENLVEIGGKNYFVVKDKEKMLATVGVSDLIIVDTADALLISSKDGVGKVGEIVEILKERGKEKYI